MIKFGSRVDVFLPAKVAGARAQGRPRAGGVSVLAERPVTEPTRQAPTRASGAAWPSCPSLFTTANLFLGFWAIIRTLHGRFEEAAPLIGWAIVLDLLDGRIARLTGTTSEFGGELDSLADVISFGVAPALLAYLWAFQSLERLGWLVAFLFVMCGTLRLARFNVQRHVVDSRYFVGLPIPAAAAQVAAWVTFMPDPAHGTGARCGRAGPGRDPRVPDGQHHSLPLVQAARPAEPAQLRDGASGSRSASCWWPITPRAVLLVLASAYWLSGPTFYLASLTRRRPGPPAAVAADQPS